MRPTCIFVLFCLWYLSFIRPPALKAALFDYQISCLASGTAGSAPFSNAALTIDVYADPSTVTEGPPPEYSGVVYSVDEISNSLSIGGIGSGAFTSAVGFFDNQTSSVLGIQLLNNVALDQFDLFDLNILPFSSYNLESTFSSISLSSSNVLALSQFPDASTTFGTVSIESVSNVFYQTTSVPVPEPSAMAIAWTGLIVFRWTGRRKRLRKLDCAI